MKLEELIQDLISIRQLRGGDASVKIEFRYAITGNSELTPLRIKADTSTGTTIVKIIAE